MSKLNKNVELVEQILQNKYEVFFLGKKVGEITNNGYTYVVKDIYGCKWGRRSRNKISLANRFCGDFLV